MRSQISKKAAKRDMDLVIHVITQVCKISDQLRSEIYDNLYDFKYKKDEIIVPENGKCNYMYFIKKGALMGCTTYKGRKIVTYMTIENEFVSSISGLYGKAPSKEEISAIEDSHLIAIPNDVLLSMFQRHFDLNFLFRIMVEQYYMDAQERTHIVRVGSARERYLYFTQTKPGYMDRLPIEYIASLLDMKPLTLVKIRKQFELSEKQDQKTEELCKRIDILMLQQEIFRDKDLNLKSCSSILEVTTHKLSSILNNYYHQNFVDFINTYRINNIKCKLAQHDTMLNFTIEALAYDAGFSSRSAFYNSFKKLVGMSPVAYLKAL